MTLRQAAERAMQQFPEEDQQIIDGWMQDAPAVNRWIPCSERLPDIDVPVLTWDGHYISVERRIEYFLYNDEETGRIERQYGEYWIDGVEGDEENPIGLRDGTATHWMPLPESPESEVQE